MVYVCICMYVNGFLFCVNNKNLLVPTRKRLRVCIIITPDIVNESKLKIFLVKMCNTIILSIQISFIHLGMQFPMLSPLLALVLFLPSLTNLRYLSDKIDFNPKKLVKV